MSMFLLLILITRHIKLSNLQSASSDELHYLYDYIDQAWNEEYGTLNQFERPPS